MGHVHLLTVDLGNSRLKACCWAPSGGGFECVERWDANALDLAGFEGWLKGRPATVAAFSSVGSAESTARVGAMVAARAARFFLEPDSGLTNRCREPERVGSDRLHAAAGAAALFGRSAIVVDAGTALTVDALLVQGSARVFLGGAIAPGPALAAAALAGGTAHLPRIEPRPGARALGTITEEALQGGVVVGFRGAAAELVEELAKEAELADSPVVLTGGAREFLLVPCPFTARELHVVPDLVQRGLLAALVGALEPREVC